MLVALVFVVDVFIRVVLVLVTLMRFVEMLLFVGVVFVFVALVRFMQVLTGVMLVLVTFMDFVDVCRHVALLGPYPLASTE